MMKKYLMTLVAVVLSAMGVQAQAPDLSQFLSIDTVNFKTVQKFTHDFATENYVGEKMYAGMQSISFELKGAHIPDVEGKPTVEIPDIQLDTLTALLTLNDKYEREHFRSDSYLSDEILFEVNDYFAFKSGYWSQSSAPYMVSFVFARGGEYILRSQFDFIGFDKQKAVTIYDEPSLRIVTDNVVKIGEDADVMAFFNTGYPYDINSLTGDEHAKVTVYKQLTDSTVAELSVQQYPLHLKDEAHPLVAGIDTLQLKLVKPELGNYLIRIESSWDAIETRDLFVSVQDTLRATVTLDKQTYDLATDKDAQLHIKMDYGYPHVVAVKPDTIPTIRISANLIKAVDDNTTINIFADTLVLASDTLATKDLRYEGDWMLDLTKVESSGLTADDSTFFQVAVIFNGGRQYETAIPLKLKPAATGITTATEQRTDDDIYTLNGIRISSRQQLSPGIYIRKGRKVIIK